MAAQGRVAGEAMGTDNEKVDASTAGAVPVAAIARAGPAHLSPGAVVTDERTTRAHRFVVDQTAGWPIFEDLSESRGTRESLSPRRQIPAIERVAVISCVGSPSTRSRSA